MPAISEIAPGNTNLAVMTEAEIIKQFIFSVARGVFGLKALVKSMFVKSLGFLL